MKRNKNLDIPDYIRAKIANRERPTKLPTANGQFGLSIYVGPPSMMLTILNSQAVRDEIEGERLKCVKAFSGPDGHISHVRSRRAKELQKQRITIILNCYPDLLNRIKSNNRLAKILREKDLREKDLKLTCLGPNGTTKLASVSLLERDLAMIRSSQSR